MRWHLALAIGVVTACAAAPEPLHRPRPQPEPPMAQVEARRVPRLVTLPPSLAAILDEVQPDELTPAMRRLLPPAPVVTNPGRPPAGGDALALADRALHQGDARDAITQLLPLTASANHDVATYARWRLAKAYLQLREVDRAEALLREVAASHRPEAWAALVLLAETLAARDGAAKTVARLEPLLAGAQATRDQLERAVLLIGPARSRAALLLERAARTTDDRPCACELAAVVLDRAHERDISVARCLTRLRSRWQRDQLPEEVVLAFAASLRAERPLRRLADAALRWRKLDQRASEPTSVEAWVALSLELTGVTGDLTSAAWVPAQTSAVDALANAALRAVAGAAVSRADLDRALEIRDSVRQVDRERANAIVHVLFERATREDEPVDDDDAPDDASE